MTSDEKRGSRTRARVFAVAGIALLAGAAVTGLPAVAPQAPAVVVHKSPTCGCCTKWVEHLQGAGFTVQVHDMDDVEPIKNQQHVPVALRSCHTAIVGGYVFEGHVPADLIQKFLKEKPAFAGLAVPGMPMGSPGMEGPSKDAYNVVAFDQSGTSAVYAKR